MDTNNIIDISQQLELNRQAEDRAYGVMHSKTYQVCDCDWTGEIKTVHIEIYARSNNVQTCLNICFEKDIRMIELNEKEAVKLAEDILEAACGQFRT